jgi:hypothetical protein
LGDDRDNRVVAVGLLTQRDLAVLGTGFKCAFPIGETTDFDQLLAAIDRADRKRPRRPDC